MRRENCAADGGAPPERFDHLQSLVEESLPFHSSLNFLRILLRTSGPDPRRNRGQITALVGLALSGFRVRLATRRDDDARKIAVVSYHCEHFLDIHKSTATSGFFGSGFPRLTPPQPTSDRRARQPLDLDLHRKSCKPMAMPSSNFQDRLDT